MKIAVISDVHGFSLALDAVLADIDAEGVDRIIGAGDLCEAGPDPLGVIDRLRERGISSVQGNTDRDLASNSRSSASFRYTLDQIGPDGLDYLGALPFEIRVSPPGSISPEADLLVVHANPYDQDQKLDPSAEEDEIRELIGDTKAAVLAFGHIHIAYVRKVGEMTLIDVSAVGNPKDGDLRSKWGLISWDETTQEWTVSLRYVSYPLEATIAQIHASDLPNPDKVVSKLVKASY